MLVVSSAIKRDNPELVAARAQRASGGAARRDAGRADAAEELVAIAGTHGKTTTTSLVGDAAGRRRGSIRPSSMAASSTPTAPIRASAPATGWWSRPTNATAASCACRPTSRSSPISTPSTSTISGPSRRCRRLQTFVENMPFYGFAVMCIDHPAVQQMIGRVADRRIVTYGENPQADVRADGLEPCRRRLALLGRVPRPRRQRRHTIATSPCRCWARTMC